jgi:hypothetical protein
MIGYEIDFAFCERPGFPPKAMLTCFRKTADEVIELLDYLGREHLYSIQLTYIEEFSNEHRPQTSASGSPSGS